MLTKLRIKNYKCFQDTGELEIRPLTFLVGPNSSGKSTLMQILLMLRQTIDSTDSDNALIANDKWIQTGAFPEFIYKGESKRELEINFELTSPNEVNEKYNGKRMTLRVKSIFKYNHKSTQIELKESKVDYEGLVTLKDEKQDAEVNIIQQITQTRRKTYSASISYVNKKNPGRSKKTSYTGVRPIKFYGFRRKLKEKDMIEDLDPSPSLIEPLWVFGSIIENEFLSLFYLGPLREFPKRFYVTSGQAPQDVGIRGERAIDVLWYSHLSKKETIKKIETEVKKWFNKFDMANNIILERAGKGNYYLVVVVDPATGTKVNIADIGFGASQTLPVIIESFYAPTNSIILIEQPEIHLHPRAQSILGDLFIKAASEADRTFIIETHSEHILARVRRRIAENMINREDVAIYYFEPTSDGTIIQEVTLNEQGQYESFPEGFFEEDVIEAFEHLKAIAMHDSECDSHD